MKTKIVVCRACGYEKKVKIYDRQDAEKYNIRLAPPRCERCGSTNIKLVD